MRVIYNTCIADPWAKVAQKLQKEYGFEPVYWIGYEYFEDDNSKEIIPKLFPNAIYQPYYDAWKGIFPAEITQKYSEAYINIDFLRNFGVYELQAIKMMDRLDYDRYSFNFMERERHFLNLVKYWTACIEVCKPDIVISALLPHRVYDYVLYLLCKFYNIKYVCFQYTLCPERVFAVSDIFSIGNLLDKDFELYRQRNLTEQDLPQEIYDVLKKVRSDYSIAAPSYMAVHPVLDKKASKLSFLGKRFINHNNLLGPDSFLKKGLTKTYYKNKKYSLENTHFNLLELVLNRKKTFKYNKALKKYYSSLTSKPDYSVPYIMFFPHYQPEATSSPGGDIFVNQRLCVETLLKHTPKDYYIYIKEHPNQFMSHMQGHTSRIKEFYDDLAILPRVKLIPFEIDSYTLIRNAKAIATITGTVGWEAMVQKKPVIAFGIIWYEKYSGVLRITDEASATRITHFIETYQYSESDLLAYLMAFSKNTVKAYHYIGRKKKVNIPEEECIDNLIKEIRRVAD